MLTFQKPSINPVLFSDNLDCQDKISVIFELHAVMFDEIRLLMGFTLFSLGILGISLSRSVSPWDL